MDTRRTIRNVVSILFFLFLESCTSSSPPTPYRPPTPAAPATTVSSTLIPTPLTPTIQSTALCYNDLAFLYDVTIPDNTIVAPGSIVDKQWRVQNTGTCDWNSGYRLRFLGASLLGAVQEQALYPSRAGSEALLRIQFTAPLVPGQYVSLWQAVDSSGVSFGDIFQMTIIVEP